jgi:hypothetical protein
VEDELEAGPPQLPHRATQILHGVAASVQTTFFSQAIGLAATFDPEDPRACRPSHSPALRSNGALSLPDPRS